MKPQFPIALAFVVAIVTIPPARSLISSRTDYGFPFGIFLICIPIAIGIVAIWQLAKGKDNEKR